jgi:glycosyltransferase involved in cell wall biosynthesis
MHIGIDARLPAYQMGGISQYILHLLPALAEIDGENRYTVFHSRKEVRNHLPPAGRLFRHRNLWTPCHHRWERWTLALEVWPRRLDVLHSPDFIPPAFGARRRVITVHDLNFLYYPEFLTAASLRYYAGQIRWAVGQAGHVLADSEHTRRDLIEKLALSPQRVTAVPLAANPLYSQSFSPEAVRGTLARYRLPHDFILFVGTLEPRKNVPGLLRAYHRLRRETALDPPLVLVGGKGWLYDEVFDVVDQLGLRSCVHHLPGVTDVELAHLYTAAALLALPSYYEGFGLPPLEAMHCGCPVVSSNRASLPEVVGQGGILLDPEDLDAWVSAMQLLLSDGEARRRLVDAGHQQARRFTWRQTATATLGVYLDKLP